MALSETVELIFVHRAAAEGRPYIYAGGTRIPSNVGWPLGDQEYSNTSGVNVGVALRGDPSSIYILRPERARS